MKYIILFSLFMCFHFKVFSQKFTFTNEEGVVFSFNINRADNNFNIDIGIENSSKNILVYIDFSGNYSFNEENDSTLFWGLGFDYSIYPYAHDLTKRKYIFKEIAPKMEIKQSFLSGYLTIDNFGVNKEKIEYFSDKITLIYGNVEYIKTYIQNVV